METTTAPRAQAAESVPAAFRQLLANTLVTSVTSSFLWFALTFWVYLESRSVVATGCIAGAFSISSAVLGPVFGTFVDRRRKHTAMVVMTTLSVAAFAAATVVFVAVDSATLLRLGGPWFWLLVGLTLLGSVAAQMRGIALSTTVTLLVPEDRRDRANGMVGTVTGVSFALTSVFSGLVIGGLGMGWASTAPWRSPSPRSPTCGRSTSTSRLPPPSRPSRAAAWPATCTSEVRSRSCGPRPGSGC